MKKRFLILMGSLLICSSILAEEITLNKKPWHVLGFFDGENAELEKICEYNINQLEAVDSTFAKIVVVYDRTFKKSRDSSVRIYDIVHDIDRTKIISNSITIGKNVVASFIEIVSKKDALYNKATISALDLDSLDITVFKKISDDLLRGISDPKTRNRYLTAVKNTLESAIHFQPIGRNRILTHYDIEDFLNILEDNLNKTFGRSNSSVIQSYSNSYVEKASGLSILFFKDLSKVSSVRKKDLFRKYSKSKFAKETGWDELMMTYHEHIIHQSRDDSLYNYTRVIFTD